MRPMLCDLCNTSCAPTAPSSAHHRQRARCNETANASLSYTGLMTDGDHKAVRRAVNFARNLQHEHLLKVGAGSLGGKGERRSAWQF
jgi:hypothetical protein